MKPLLVGALWVILFGFVCAAPAHAQKAPSAPDPKADYSQEAYVVEEMTPSNPSDELGRARTVKLARIVPGSASAEFFLLFGPENKVENVAYISGAEALKKSESVLSTTKFQVPFPEGSDARILRRGLLMCSEIVGCEIVFYPLDSVHSVN